MTYNKQSTRYYSERQEKSVAKKIVGKVVPNSGAATFVAGDVVTKDWLIECKTKTKDCSSFTIKEDWLLKNEEEAFAMGKNNSALCFDFGPSANKRYYVISERLFETLKNYLEEEN
ncbi:hypothetical protein J6O48_08310 [bacterium]|nr:hypothetical protein [bacterium]